MSTIREIDGELSAHWYIAALSSELGRRAVLARTIYGKHYALFRTDTGEVRVLEDRCLHRGTKLSEGNCDGATLRCPYHGWAYKGDGTVIDIPSEGPCTPELTATITGRGWKIPALSAVELDGVIWVWMGEDSEGKPSMPNPGNPPWRFPFGEDPAWTHYFMVTDFANEVTHLAQNFMDVPHTVFVHAKWFRDKVLMKVPYRLDVGNGRVKATYLKPDDTIGGIMRYVLNPARKPMEHTDEFVFPNLTRVDYRFGENGFVINSQCTPVDRYRTRVYTWIAYRGIAFAPLLKPVMRFYTRQVIEQDVRIMENQGSNLLRHPDRTDWKSTAADEIHIAITRLRELGVKSRVEAQTQPMRATQERTFWI
jgi:phenylpropionate dioxygenase-like ring-hydroxylating dioxygenase large terminal subunit